MSVRTISIITPSLNRARLLVFAIRSVIAQEYPNYEHIIIDGGSTDDTVRLVEKFPGIRFVSAPDRGMYDALNKGLEMASGEIVGFLNTDDLYADGCFTSVARNFDVPDIMAVAGRAIVFTELENKIARIVEEYSPVQMGLMEASTIGSNYFNAWFFRREVFRKIGVFNPDFKIAGDREFMLRFALNKCRYTVVDELVYKYRSHPGSFTFEKNSGKRVSSATEHLAMTDVYLSNPAAIGSERRLVIRLRTKETVELAARSLWELDFRKVLHYLIEGFKYDPAWLLRFLEFAIRRGVAWLRTGNRFRLLR